MIRSVLANHEIGVRVVSRVAIDVMYMRAFRERLPERLFRNDDMPSLSTVARI
jgi:hypothetical protein